MEGVTVDASSPALIERARTAVTNGAGRYRIEDLRPGVYRIRFTHQGWSPYQLDGVELTGSFTATVDATLAIGPRTETVAVSLPAVDVHASKHETTLTGELAASLPTVRSYNALLVLIPGIVTNVNDVVTGTASTSFPIHGGRTNEGRLTARRADRRQPAQRQFRDELRRRRRDGPGDQLHYGRRAGGNGDFRTRHEHRAEERRQRDAGVLLRRRHRQRAAIRQHHAVAPCTGGNGGNPAQQGLRRLGYDRRPARRRIGYGISSTRTSAGARRTARTSTTTGTPPTRPNGSTRRMSTGASTRIGPTRTRAAASPGN